MSDINDSRPPSEEVKETITIPKDAAISALRLLCHLLDMAEKRMLISNSEVLAANRFANEFGYEVRMFEHPRVYREVGYGELGASETEAIGWGREPHEQRE